MSRPATPQQQVLARLAELAEQGTDGLPRVARPARAAAKARPARSAEPPAAAAAPSLPASAARPARQQRPAAPPVAASAGPAAPGAFGPDPASSADLLAMRAALGDCRRCKLCEGRTQVVFGVGNPSARLMFVGEGPGRDEDLQGEPFVGRAGQLLTDMIEKGMGLKRAEVYIANVVKCRPPENRNPEPDEVAACSPFLKRQVALVGPEVIVALGKFAAQTLLSTETPISKLRGRWHELDGIALMPTFHPAYLLRNPAEKRSAWADLKLVMARLGL